MHTLPLLLNVGLKVVGTAINVAGKASAKSDSKENMREVKTEVAELSRNVELQKAEIQSQLRGIAKKDLFTSVSYYNEGVEYLYEVFDNMQTTAEKSNKSIPLLTGTLNEVCLQSFTMCLELVSNKNWYGTLDESTLRCLLSAKKRFKDSRKKATEAFNNDLLDSSDIITAMQLRILATILESIDHPIDAIPACKICLEELHSLPYVKTKFKDFQEIIYHLNRIVCEVTQRFGRRGSLLSWPCVVLKKKKIDPRMVYCGMTTWSFGHKGEDSEKLDLAWSITSNSFGEFIVLDSEDHNVKIFDIRCKFIRCLVPFADESKSESRDDVTELWNVATDKNDNIVILGHKKNTSDSECPMEASQVFVYSNSMDFIHSFILQEGFRGSSLAVGESNRLFITGGEFSKFHKNLLVGVYGNDGKFFECFGEGIISHALDISAGNRGQVLVLDRDAGVLVFSAVFEPLVQFEVGKDFSAIAFHPVTEDIFVASPSQTGPKVLVYSKDGNKEREIEFAKEGVPIVSGMTVTSQGHIAVTGKDSVLYV